MSELPASWLACTLGDVTDYGATVKAEPDEIPPDAWVLELEDIEKDTSRILQRATFNERKSKSTKNRFEIGEVLYGKLRPYLNKVVLADQGGYCTTEIVPLKASGSVAAKYLFYWLKHPQFLDYVTEVSHGLNMPRLGTDAGRSAPFILAPLAEQKRIADKLETVLARVDACRARLDRVPDLLKRFRQSVLAAATSGVLSEDWRTSRATGTLVVSFQIGEDSVSIPSEWTRCALVDVIDPSRPLCYGVVQPGEEDQKGARLIRVQDLMGGRIDVEALRTISSEVDAEYRRSRIRAGDLLISVVGTIGRTALVPQNLEANIARAIARISCRAGIDSRWVNYWLSRETVQWWMTSASKEVARKTLNLSDLTRAPIAVPPLPEQHEIVRRVDALFAFAGRIEARLAVLRAQIDRLTPALLAKAFRGELVPQDPNDEPASVLLERVRAALVEKPKVRRRKLALERTP